MRDNAQMSLADDASQRAKIVSAGVDWVTATAVSEHKQAVLYGIGIECLELVEQRIREPITAVEQRGYRGYKVGGLFVGKRDDSVMLRGSSEDAGVAYARLYEQGERFAITRLDLQATGQFDYDNEGCARATEAQAIEAAARQAVGRPGRVASVRGNGRGDTCSIGSRTSQRYLRCYDKTREQRGEVDENLWRWEVEYKAQLAQGVAERIAAHNEQRRAIIGTVATEFYRKGVSVPWDRDTGIDIPTTGVSASDDGRRLRWLSMQVRPVVARLVGSVGLSAVLIALDLQGLLDRESD